MFARANTGVAGCLAVVSLLLAGGLPSLALDPAMAIPQSIRGETPWFVTSLLAVFLLILFTVYRSRMRQMERREQELEALVARRTQELREATLRDDLTGLRNRRFLQEIVQPEMSLFAERKQYLTQHDGPRAANPAGRYMGIFVIDIDHFKQINDSYGHGAGDRVLQQFAAVLGQAMRKDDIAVRWGGEEFLVVLRDTAYEHIAQFATEVRRRIENSLFNVSEDPEDTVHRTCSIGYAPFPFHRDEPARISFDQAVLLAELGLHHAERTGRNRTVGVMPTDTPPSMGDLAPLVASLEYGEENGILQVQLEEAMVDEAVLV